MKILNDNYTKKTNEEATKTSKPYPRKLICEGCGSELQYEESDVRIGALGCCYIDCPLCGRDNLLEDHEKSITLTIDNVEFPIHFFHTSATTGAVDVCNNEEVKECIRRAVAYFKKNDNDFNWFTAYGNLYVIVFKIEDDGVYNVIVTNDYYETDIPFTYTDN